MTEWERGAVGLVKDGSCGPAAFAGLYDHLALKAEEIKGEHVVSKQVLRCLLSIEGAIRSRAQYVPAVREDIPLITKFAMLLELIAIGESPADRVTGQPRTI